ncbi:MAG: radical SAM protein [Clostridium chrysemydis]|uniref:radical SAM protein n=1 Tax=Clostridium chrysemydis TaxID=2665504 RepID=UPI003F2E2965
MKWSQFILKFNDKNNIILFNTYNKATVSLELEQYQCIDEYLSNKECEIGVNKEYVDSLINLEFIVDINFDERLNLYEKIDNVIETTEKLTVVLLTTTACNFKCAYCYENGISRSNSFNISDIEEILNILKKHIEIKKTTEIELTLFGGEPTLNWSFTKEFISNFKGLCVDKNIKFKLDIITNGYLLDTDKIKLLLENNLSSVQVTLDGIAEVHDNRRALINGNKTFEVIIKNIEKLLYTSIEKVNIRINYDKSNAGKITELLEYLAGKFNDFKYKIEISFGIIDSNLVNDNKDNIIKDEKMLETYYTAFYKQVLKMGFNTTKYFETGTICMAKRSNSVIISPDKKVYKCLSLVGMEDGVVGDFTSNIVELKSYFNMELYEECFQKKCEFIPMCHMGCKFKAFINTGRFDSNDCEYEALKRINTGIIKSLYGLS